MRRHVLLAFVPLLMFSVEAYALAWREAAPTLAEAAPDQETFHDFLAPAASGDESDRREADAERTSRIAELKKDYETNPSAITRAGDLYELSALYQERSFYLRDQAVNDYTAAVDKWRIGELLAQPALKLDAAREELLKRVNVLRDMVTNFHNDPRIDELNWQLASTMARLGNDHCEFYFKQSIGPAKTDDWATKARLSEADYLVSTKHLDEAIAAYNAVRAKAPDDLKAYATYRLGWAYLSKGLAAAAGAPRDELLKKAEAALKLVVVSVKEDKETRYRLRAEAAYDLAWLWAVTGNEKEPPVFFEKQDLEGLLPVFREKLAAAWLVQGRLDKAAPYYQDQIAKDPTSPRVPDILLKLCQAYIVAGDMAGLNRETAALERITTKQDDPWFEEHGNDEKLVGRTRKMLAQLPLTAGFKLFEAAGTEKNPKRRQEMFANSVKELQAYAAKAPNDPEMASLRATLVQALIGQEKYPEALDQLDLLMKLGPKAETYIPNAAMERLNILVKLDSAEKYPPVPEPATVKSPLPLPPLKKRFAAAAGDYLRIVPKAEIEPNLRYQVAMDLFTYGHYDEALPLFEKLVTDFPRSDQARVGIETMLSYHLKHDHWDDLVRLSTDLLNNRNVKGKSLRDYIKQNLDYAKERSKKA